MDETEYGEGDATKTFEDEGANADKPPSRLGALLQARLQGVGGTSTDGFTQRPGSSPAGEGEAGRTDALQETSVSMARP